MFLLALVRQLLVVLSCNLEVTSGKVSTVGVVTSRIGLRACMSTEQYICVLRWLASLSTVRSVVSVIPQSPDILKSTLREKMGPVGEDHVTDICATLERVRIPFSISHILNFRIVAAFLGLSQVLHGVSRRGPNALNRESGSLWSAKQR